MNHLLMHSKNHKRWNRLKIGRIMDNNEDKIHLSVFVNGVEIEDDDTFTASLVNLATRNGIFKIDKEILINIIHNMFDDPEYHSLEIREEHYD